MTTVCYDGQHMVSDSQSTFGQMSSLTPFKKIHEPEEGDYWEVNGVKVIVFGISGNAMAVENLKEKLRENLTYKTRFNEEEMQFSTIIVDENGRTYRWNCNKTRTRPMEILELLPTLPPVAVGSGYQFAMGILAIGKDAKSAVKTAIRLDPHSGGELQIWEFPGKPDKPSVRPVKAKTTAKKSAGAKA